MWHVDLQRVCSDYHGDRLFSCSTFSQTHKIDTAINIANIVLPYICSFLLYLYHIMFVNVKLDISGCHSGIFEDCRLHWFGSFPMVLPKQNWQCWQWNHEWENGLWRPLQPTVFWKRSVTKELAVLWIAMLARLDFVNIPPWVFSPMTASEQNATNLVCKACVCVAYPPLGPGHFQTPSEESKWI